MRDGAEVAISQPKQRAVLALLLATPGESVPVSEMIDALWPAEPAGSVLNQVHRHIGALRRLCEPSLQRRQVGRYIVAVGSGYRVRVTADTCDVLAFRDLVRRAEVLSAAGKHHDAFQAYLAALQIAPAPAGDDAQRHLPAFVGLEDERLRAIIAAADHSRTVDESAALLPVLRSATGRHRLNETLHAAAMTVLCRAGRPGDALAVYRTIHDALDDELGAVPSAVLAAAHALALGGSESDQVPYDARRPDVLPVVPAQLPSPLPGFVGRQAERQAMRVQAPTSGRILLTGMAGVGKTSLALRHAADVAANYPDGQLYLNLRGFDATVDPVDPLTALHDLLHGLGVAPTAVPQSLGARSGLLRSIVADRRVLIVLDNARDYRQIEPLLPGSGPNLVIITSRNSMPALVAFNQAHPVGLGPFDDEQVVEFFANRLSKARIETQTDAIIQLGRACAGLPLALAVIAARAEANPRFPLDLFVREFTQGHQPLRALKSGSDELDLSTVFSWSLQGLSADATRTFAMLGAHPGPEISAAAIASMSGLDAELVRTVVDELTTANVLREVEIERFVLHDLVRQYARDVLGDDWVRTSERLVSHYVRSTANAITSFGQRPTAPSGADTAPGIVAEQFASSSEATRWYAEQRHVLHAVCRLAIRLGDHRSALALMLDWRPMSQAIDARHDMLPFAALAIQAAEQIDDPSLRAEAYRDAASNFARTDQPDQARTYFDKAAESYRTCGDRLGLASLYRSMAVTQPMDAGERIDLLLESVAIVREIDDRPTLAVAMHSLGLGYLWAGRHEDALHAFDDSLAIAATAGNLNHLEAHVLSARSRALARAGRLDEAADAAAPALRVFRRDGATHAELRLLHSHGEVLTALGRRAEAAQAWRRYLALATGPDHIRETNALDDDSDGAATIERITAQLAALNG